MKLDSLRRALGNNSFLRYFLVGGWNAFFSLSFFYISIIFFGNSLYEVILFITFLVSTIQSYSSQKFFVWKRERANAKEFLHFFAVCGVQYLINSALLFVLVGLLHYSPKIMQLPVSIFIAISSYFYFKKRVFKERPRGNMT